MQQDIILVLDLGSEENPKIAREIRALGVYSEIHPHDLTAQQLSAIPNIRGIILMRRWRSGKWKNKGFVKEI